jgi:dihydrofolate reductase
MKAILAMSLNRVIGNNGLLPWYIPEDFKFFRKMTSDPINGGILLMGRKTFESIPRPLYERFIYVLTKNPELRGKKSSYHCYIFEEDLVFLKNVDYKIWLCGGAEIYNAYISKCDEVYVTIVLDEYIGNSYMLPFEDNFPNSKIIKESRDFWIVKYYK